jgi:hypothetical protein
VVRPLDFARESLGKPVLDVIRFADHVEAHLPRPDGVPFARLLGKLDTIVGQDLADPVRHRFQYVFKELSSRRSPVSLVDEP